MAVGRTKRKRKSATGNRIAFGFGPRRVRSLNPERSRYPFMPLSDTIGLGFIGAGDISILHAKAVQRCAGTKLVGLWNRSQDRAKQRASEFGCKNYETPEALCADP